MIVRNRCALLKPKRAFRRKSGISDEHRNKGRADSQAVMHSSLSGHAILSAARLRMRSIPKTKPAIRIKTHFVTSWER
jgi:hypothetical protein